MPRLFTTASLAAVLASALALGGCATQEAVEHAQATADDAMTHAQASGAAAQKAQQTADAAASSAQAAGAAAQAAQGRADAAYQLAQGKFNYEVVSTDASTLFDTGKDVLSQADKDQLTAFAQKLKSDNKNVYLEIEGHADRVGSRETNLDLGRRRAIAVGHFLHDEAGIPLNRMSILSYGEDKPVAPPMKHGNPANRCVVITVLQ